MNDYNGANKYGVLAFRLLSTFMVAMYHLGILNVCRISLSPA